MQIRFDPNLFYLFYLFDNVASRSPYPCNYSTLGTSNSVIFIIRFRFHLVPLIMLRALSSIRRAIYESEPCQNIYAQLVCTHVCPCVTYSRDDGAMRFRNLELLRLSVARPSDTSGGEPDAPEIIRITK